MTRRRLFICLGVAAAFGGGGGGELVSVAPAASRPAVRMLVYAQEFRLFSSRATVPAGHVSVTLWNRGQDVHDLRVRRLGGSRGAAAAVSAPGIAPLASGGLATASWRLPAGRYELYCALANHRKLGMHAVLVVR